jgi:hypothetical protein
MMCIGANVVAAPVNNYAFSSTMKLDPATAKSMTNLTFDWSAVTKDFLGHTLNTVSDLNTVTVLMFQLPLADLQTKLNDDSLSMSDVYVVPPPSWPDPGQSTGGATSAQLYSFSVNGTHLMPSDFNMYFDPATYPASMFSYVVTAATGTTVGTGFRMLQSFQLDPNSSATTVALTNTSTKLSYTANLHSLTITGVPSGTAALTLDWSQMEMGQKNALGHDFTQGYITDAVVGHYTETPAQLEGKFLDIDLIATKYYRASIPSGSVLDFTTLMDASGAAFPGIDDTGTWLVGLTCGICRNPAPWYLTILKPCTPAATN